MKDKISEVVEFRLRLTLAERMQLELMAAANGFTSHHQLARSIIQSVLEDDRVAHENNQVALVEAAWREHNNQT